MLLARRPEVRAVRSGGSLQRCGVGERDEELIATGAGDDDRNSADDDATSGMDEVETQLHDGHAAASMEFPRMCVALNLERSTSLTGGRTASCLINSRIVLAPVFNRMLPTCVRTVEIATP